MKRLNKYLLVAFFMLGGVVYAQNVEFKRSNFKDNSDGFKKAEAAIDKGEEFFEKGMEAVFKVEDPGLNFRKAREQFQIAQDLNPDNALNNYRMGVCYIYSDSPYKGISYVKKAHQLNPECDDFLYYFYGYSLQMEKKFDKAIEAYGKFTSSYKKADQFSKFVRKHQRECEFAKTKVADPERCWVDNLKSLNTEYNEIAPTTTMAGAMLIFSSDKPNGHQPKEMGDYDYNIYISTIEKGKFSKAKPLPGSVNTTVDDVVNNLSYDGTKLLLHRENNGQTDIYESRLDGKRWGEPVVFPRQISHPEADDKYASYDPSGFNIYFARENTTRNRGTDIMKSGMQSKMKKDYRIANIIGALSSKFNDGPLYVYIDDRTMYIASEGFQSIGGYDIFVSYREKGSWSRPKNMGYPINTPYDDYFFAVTASGKYAYISSNRPGGKGGFDLYKVTFWGPPKEPIVDVENYLIASIAKPMKDPHIEDVVEVNTVSLTVFKGKTIDAITQKPVEAKIEITDNEKGEVINTFTTNSATGKFLLSLKAGKNYGIAVEADGYLFHSENFDIPENSAYNLVNKVIKLKNIAIGSKIQLRNIFFDVGKSTLRSASNSELNRLVSLLKAVPSLKIEISGHTDNTGSASLNKQLSQDRAQSVVDYLINHGVSKGRLNAKGYGETQPVESNSTNWGRQQNRRTEFKITAN